MTVVGNKKEIMPTYKFVSALKLTDIFYTKFVV